MRDQQASKYGKQLYAVEGYDIASRDYMVSVAEGGAPLLAKLNLRSVNNFARSASFGYHVAQYLQRRGDERVKDWATNPLPSTACHHRRSDR